MQSASRRLELGERKENPRDEPLLRVKFESLNSLLIASSWVVLGVSAAVKTARAGRAISLTPYIAIMQQLTIERMVEDNNKLLVVVKQHELDNDKRVGIPVTRDSDCQVWGVRFMAVLGVGPISARERTRARERN